MLFVISQILPCLLGSLALGAAFGYLFKKLLQNMIPQPDRLPDFSHFALKSDLPKAADLGKYALKSELPSGEFLTASALAPVMAWKSEVGDPKAYLRKTELPSGPDLSGYALKSELPKLPD